MSKVINSGKLAALALCAYLVGGGMGLATGMRAGEYRTALKYAEQTAEQAQAERDNADELARQWRGEYYSALIEIAQLKSELEANDAGAEAMDSGDEEGRVLSAPEQGTYDAEFGWDFDHVVRVVGAEARGEPFEGMLAVAQCIKDAADASGVTPEEIVKDLGYGYAAPVGREVLDGMEAVNEACLQVFANGARATDEPIEFFYSTRNGGYSAWHEAELRFVMQIGDHRFFARA